jgi:TRAP-type C4-dicarboxylate transport system permease small subunit
LLTRFTQFSNRISGWAEWLTVCGLLGIVGLTCVDVVGSKAFSAPIMGSTEIVSAIQVIAMAAALAITQVDGRHVRVEFVIEKLRTRTRVVLNIITSLLALVFFSLLVWKAYEMALNYFIKGTVSGTAEIPYYPSAFLLSLCCIPMCLVLLSELLNSIKEAVKK